MTNLTDYYSEGAELHIRNSLALPESISSIVIQVDQLTLRKLSLTTNEMAAHKLKTEKI